MPYPYPPDRSQGELHAHCDNTAGFAAYEDDACKAAQGRPPGHVYSCMGHPEDSKVSKPQRSQSMIEFRTLAYIIDGYRRCVCVSVLSSGQVQVVHLAIDTNTCHTFAQRDVDWQIFVDALRSNDQCESMWQFLTESVWPTGFFQSDSCLFHPVLLLMLICNFHKLCSGVSERVGIDCSCFSLGDHHFSTRTCAEKMLWLRAISNVKAGVC